MDISKLANADLNLLVTLYAIYQERSISRAADKLFVTRSAASKALSRARALLDDPLFTLSSNQLVPTPGLESIAPQLRSTLTALEAILQPAQFDAATWKGEIKLAFPESIDIALLPKLLTFLSRAAPGITVKTIHYTPDALNKLAQGDLDFVIHLEYNHYPEDYVTERFISSPTVILGRQDHPLQEGEVTAAQTIEYPRVSIPIPDWRQTRTFQTLIAMEATNHGWGAIFETGSALSALSIIENTDCLLPVPEILAKKLAEEHSLKTFSVKGFERVTFNYRIVLHQRIAHSPVHQWFLEVLQSMGREIDS